MPGSRKKAPVFVVGCPRSGTTLLYHMLLSAGGFAIYRAESLAFGLLRQRFGDLSLLRNRRRLMRVWLHTKMFHRTGLDAAQIEAKILSECWNSGDFLRLVMEEMARAQHVERWADCTPDHLLYLREIKRTIPDALVVHVIRDGRDAALSLHKQGWIRPFSWDRKHALLACGAFWEWNVKKGRRHSQTMGGDYTEVRFEELVTTPRETLERLGRFIGHDLDYERILKAAIGSVADPNTSFARDGKAFNPVGRWRQVLSPQDLADFEQALGGTLQALGYPLHTSPNPSEQTTVKWIRPFYLARFEAKHFVRTKTPLPRFFARPDPILAPDPGSADLVPGAHNPAPLPSAGKTASKEPQT